MHRLLDGKTAIVTGSGQGIGRCIALCLAEHGAKVITNNRKPGSSIQAFENMEISFTEEERLELMKFSGDAKTTAEEIIAAGGEAIPFYGDVSDAETARQMVQCAIDAWGRIDLIVNNASSNWTGNILDMDTDTWNTQIRSKLDGTFYLMHAALPFMVKQGYGRILNSASDAFVGIRKYAAYAAGNAGVVALSRAAAKDLSGTGITVNAYTPLARTRAWYNAKTSYRLMGVSAETVEANAPEAMKRTAEGMVPFLAWLASEEGKDVSGEVFKLAADGEIGLWSVPEVIRSVKKEDGIWRMDDLRRELPSMIRS